MRRRGLACLQRVALARGAAAASEACPARALSQRSFATSPPSSSRFDDESSQRQRRQPHHHHRSHAPRAQQRRFDAVLLDATGTLITPSEPAAEVKAKESLARTVGGNADPSKKLEASSLQRNDRDDKIFFPTSNTRNLCLSFLLSSLCFPRSAPRQKKNRSTATTRRSTA